MFRPPSPIGGLRRMSIRLNKAIRELNIGLQTAVEFLTKKGNLGDEKLELTSKISDEQYDLLVEAFRQDKEVRSQAEKLFPKKPKEKKQAPVETKESHAEAVLPSSSTQQFKPLGKIDLSTVGKKPATPAQEPEEKVVSAPEPQVAAAKPEEKEIEKVTPVVENVEPETKEQPEQQAPVKEESPVPSAVSEEETVQETVSEPVEDSKEEKVEIYQLKSEKKMLNTPQLKIQGKIDLTSINTTTRPKKKTKEEKRKEREEKAQQQNGEKKKRARINKERVDINAAANQPAADNPKKKDAGKKKKNRGRNQRPLEVNEEDVARQVKETLARLTNKQSQNKKGAKYRKEKRDAAQERLNEELSAEQAESKTLKLTEFVTVSELATMMNINVTQVISTLMSVGIMVSINQRLDAETINLVADEFGFKTEYA